MARIVLAKMLINRQSSSSESNVSISAGSTPTSAADISEANLHLLEPVFKEESKDEFQNTEKKFIKNYKLTYKKRKIETGGQDEETKNRISKK